MKEENKKQDFNESFEELTEGMTGTQIITAIISIGLIGFGIYLALY